MAKTTLTLSEEQIQFFKEQGYLRLLGSKAYGSFDHAILKPPGIGAPTPWHQDEAFRLDYARGYDEISIWIPLQAVDTDNGCLEFLPGSHRQRVLRHASSGNDPRIHALACVDEFDETKAVSARCPLADAQFTMPALCTIPDQTSRHVRAAPIS